MKLYGCCFIIACEQKIASSVMQMQHFDWQHFSILVNRYRVEVSDVTRNEFLLLLLFFIQNTMLYALLFVINLKIIRPEYSIFILLQHSLKQLYNIGQKFVRFLALASFFISGTFHTLPNKVRHLQDKRDTSPIPHITRTSVIHCPLTIFICSDALSFAGSNIGTCVSRNVHAIHCPFF